MTLESVPAAALTAAEFYAHMSTIMADFSNTISEKLGQTIDANRELSRESTKLIRDKIQTMSKGLKADAKSNRDELSKGLADLGQSISCEIAVAITAMSEHSNSLNQASLQTIINLLQNHTNVQVGNDPNATSSYTTSNAENYPESGIPPGSQLNKGKGPEVPNAATNEPPSMSHARVYR
jgi:gas vesicle protein